MNRIERLALGFSMLAALAACQSSPSTTAATTSSTQSSSSTASPPALTLSASPTSLSRGASSMLTWSATNATACTASGGWSGTLATQGSQSTGAVSATTTYTLSCAGSGGTVSQSATISVSTTGGAANRPSYNTGDGFFVLNGTLYDANGNPFRIRGVDRLHYTDPSQPGISNAKANAVRMFMGYPSTGAATYANIVQTQHIAYSEVPILAMPYFPDNTLSSCSTSTSELASGVAWWVANASTFAPLSKYLIVNIANEWGPANSSTWASSYESAITAMRAAGYTGPLLIDSGQCGQDINDLLNYSTEVFNSDPQKNIIFALHMYGNSSKILSDDSLTQLAALASSAGMVFAVTEFGPGNNIGPSPTEVTPTQIINACEAAGLGWAAWAWDDNNLSNGASNNDWFSMTVAGPGTYTGDASQLTSYGQIVVPLLQSLATPASVF
jgi:mannan endo-1,4-beta-mannosidase